MDADEEYRKSRLTKNMYVYVYLYMYAYKNELTMEIMRWGGIHLMMLHPPSPNVHYIIKRVANEDECKAGYCYHHTRWHYPPPKTP